jgi:5'-methylthioadenosine phosphorylase
MTKSFLGIIGGSGVYDLPGVKDLREERIVSPWGEPSDALRTGMIGTTRVAFLSRHGRGHRFSPTDINYRANIDVLKRAGVTDLVSVSAVGSLREDLPPGTFVIADQFIDRTVARPKSFFGAGFVAHVSMAHPVSPPSPTGSRRRRRPRASTTGAAAPMSSSRARNSPRSPSLGSTGVGVPPWSA